MLPSRAYARPSDSGPTKQASPGEVRLTIVAVAGAADLKLFPNAPYTCLAAHVTADAIRLIESARPRVVALDLDLPGVDALEVCGAARRHAETSVLVMTGAVARVPPVLRAGCHAVLLKPLTLNLVAARLGRLCREQTTCERAGFNRRWPRVPCPACGRPGAVGFEFSSHRRMWYACEGCDAVWIGPRQE